MFHVPLLVRKEKERKMKNYKKDGNFITILFNKEISAGHITLRSFLDNKSNISYQKLLSICGKETNKISKLCKSIIKPLDRGVSLTSSYSLANTVINFILAPSSPLICVPIKVPRPTLRQRKVERRGNSFRLLDPSSY